MANATEDNKIVKGKKSIANISLNIIYALIGAGIVALFVIMYIRSRA
jgi:hypothetical protein